MLFIKIKITRFYRAYNKECNLDYTTYIQWTQLLTYFIAEIIVCTHFTSPI